jgi:hypothetical protein
MRAQSRDSTRSTVELPLLLPCGAAVAGVGVEEGEGVARRDVGGENNANADVDADADAEPEPDAQAEGADQEVVDDGDEEVEGSEGFRNVGSGIAGAGGGGGGSIASFPLL